jgi:hypothetical protein
MPFDDLIVERPPTAGAPADEPDRHFFEGAVMLAYAMHLLETEPVREIRIHPDGQHATQFDFPGWLAKRGFERVEHGHTTFGGTYRHADGRSIVVHSRPGITIEAECKGGAIETRHRGRLSRLDKGLCEIVGRLMSKPSLGRQVAVVPRTAVTLRLARKLAPRRCVTRSLVGATH